MVKELSLPAYTARQIVEWVYGKHVASVDGMTNISTKARQQIAEKYAVGASHPLRESVSEDGAKKYLFSVSSGNRVEAAYIPDRDRATLCVSSQAGCRMGCAFCMTARQGMNGNLTVTDILNQFRSLPEHDKLTNIVFMGSENYIL